MRLCLIILILAFIGLANARRASSDILHERRRLWEAYQRSLVNEREYYTDSDGVVWEIVGTLPTVVYKLLPTESDFQTVSNQLTKLGGSGYTEIGIISLGGGKRATAYGHLNQSTATYSYHALPIPQSISDFLQQINTEGANGYRYQSTKYNGTTNILVYVKNSARPEANYIYQVMPVPKNLDEFLQQVNSQGGNGYVHLGSAPDGSILYMKDLSYAPTYRYLQPPFSNFSADFTIQINDLGAKGYRFSHVAYYVSPTEKNQWGFNKMYYVPLYFQDSSASNLVYNYRVLQQPAAFNDFQAFFDKQGKEGFLYINTVQLYYEEYSVQVFLDLNVCQCQQLLSDLYS